MPVSSFIFLTLAFRPTPSGNLPAKAIIAENEAIDVFTAAGIKRPDISILSDKFLADVRGLKHKNVAAELFAKLLGDEIKQGGKRNVVQS